MAAENKELSPIEVTQRAAIIRQFKELLKAQRDRFGEYLDVLEKQKDVIEKGSADSLIRHVELEEKIVEDIFSIQKVIKPLEEMYRSVCQGAGAETSQTVSDENGEAIDLKSALEGLKSEAVSRSKRNRLILSERMTEIRSEIKNLSSSPYARPLSAFKNQGLVDIQG